MNFTYIIYRKLYLFFIAILISPQNSFANDAVVEINANIRIQSLEKNSFLEYWTHTFRQVDPRKSLYLKNIPVTITRVSATEVLVELDKPANFRFYNEGQAHKYKLADFVVEMKSNDVDRIMEMHPGAIFTTERFRRAAIEGFIEQLRSKDGYTKQMHKRYMIGTPQTIFTNEAVEITLEAESLIAGEPKLIDWSYRGRFIVPNVFKTVFVHVFYKRVSTISKVIPSNSELLQRYKEAFIELKQRVAKLQARGWWPFKKHHAFGWPIYDRDANQRAPVISMTVSCRSLFAN